MITINIYYRGKNGNARKFAEEMIANLREKYDLHMSVERYVYDEVNQNIDQEHIRE